MNVDNLPSEYWVRFWENYWLQERQGNLDTYAIGLDMPLLYHMNWQMSNEGFNFWSIVKDATREEELPFLPDTKSENPNMEV